VSALVALANRQQQKNGNNQMAVKSINPCWQKKQRQGSSAVRQLMGIDGTATAINHVGSVSSSGFSELATAKLYNLTINWWQKSIDPCRQKKQQENNSAVR